MRDRIKVLNLLMTGLKTIGERKAYLENLGEEYEQLQNSSGVFIDERAYQLYSIITIDDQVWLGENLIFNSNEGTYIHEDNMDCLLKYGRLYTWEAAMRACPKGWRLPTLEELTVLAERAGGYYNVIGQKEYGDEVEGYRTLANASDNGFQMLLGGYFSDQKQFSGVGSAGVLWSASAGRGTSKWAMWFEYEESIEIEEISADFAFSVRCIQK